MNFLGQIQETEQAKIPHSQATFKGHSHKISNKGKGVT